MRNRAALVSFALLLGIGGCGSSGDNRGLDVIADGGGQDRAPSVIDGRTGVDVTPPPAEIGAKDGSAPEALDAATVDPRDAASVDARDAAPIDAHDAAPIDARDATPIDARDAAAGPDARDATADSAATCTCLGKPLPTCTPSGHLTYTLSRAAAPTAEQAAAYELIACAMEGALAYYNCNTSLTKTLSISYEPSVATADGNSNGSVRFGQKTYMQCVTAMHEIGHTLGVGTTSKWSSLVKNGLFTGTSANAQLKAINSTLTAPEYTEVHADTQHFWPYGLNYTSEAKSTADLVFNTQMVAAIVKDLGL